MEFWFIRFFLVVAFKRHYFPWQLHIFNLFLVSFLFVHSFLISVFLIKCIFMYCFTKRFTFRTISHLFSDLLHGNHYSVWLHRDTSADLHLMFREFVIWSFVDLLFHFIDFCLLLCVSAWYEITVYTGEVRCA